MEKNRSQLSLKCKVELLFVLFFLVITFVSGICLNVFNRKEDNLFSSELNVYRDKENIVSMISNYKPTTDTNAYTIIQQVGLLSDYYGFKNVNEELVYNTTLKNGFGKVYKTSQIYNGIDVYGRGLNILDRNGELDIYGNYLKDINISTTPKKSAEEIKEIFFNNENWKDFLVISEPTLTIYSLFGIEPTLSYAFTATNGNESYDVFIDANSGEIIKSITNNYGIESKNVTLRDSKGKNHSVQIDYESGIYYLRDSLRNIYVKDYSISPVAEADVNYFRQNNAKANNVSSFDGDLVQALTLMIKCYDFYADEDNIGVSLKSLNGGHDELRDYETGNDPDEIYLEVNVNYHLSGGAVYDNASFNQYSYVATGKLYPVVLIKIGTGKNYIDCDDVLIHEYQHGITWWNAGNGSGAGLTYEGQSGALNEAYSDIFASLIEGYGTSNDKFWKIGEDLTSGALRNMKSPDQTMVSYTYNGSIISSGPRNPKHYNDIHVCNITNHNLTGSLHEHDDYCDSNFVHINNSVITHSYYQMYSAYKTLKGASYSDTEFKQKIGTLLFGVLQTLPADTGFEGWALAMQQNALSFAIAEKDVDFYYAVKEGLDEVGLLQTIDESALTFYKVTFSYDTSSGESLVSGTTIGYTNNSSEILYSTNNPETSTIITLPVIKKTNYKFLGWYTSRSSTGNPVLVMNNYNQLVLTTGSAFVVTENSKTKWKLSSNLTLYPKFEVITSSVTLNKTTTLGDGVSEFISNIDGFSEVWLEDESGNKLTNTTFASGTKIYLKYSLNSNTEYNKWLTFSFVKWDGVTVSSDANGSYFIVGSDNVTITAQAKVDLKKFSFEIQDNTKFSKLEAVLVSSSESLTENTSYPSKYKIELKYEYIENAFYDLESVTWEIVSGSATITSDKYIQYAVGLIVIKIVPVEKEKIYTINLIELDSNGNSVATSNLNKLYMSSVAGDESSKYGTGLYYNQWDFGEKVYFNYEEKVGYITSISDFYYIDKQTNNVVNIAKTLGNYSLTLPNNVTDDNFKHFFGNVQDNKVLNVYVKVSTELRQHKINLSFAFADDFSGDVDSITKSNYFVITGTTTQLPSGSMAKFNETIKIYYNVESTDQYVFSVNGLVENGINVGSNKSSYYEYKITYTEQKEEDINLVILVNFETRKYQISLIYIQNNFSVLPGIVDEDGNEIVLTNGKCVLEYNETKKYYITYTLKDTDSTLYQIKKIVDKNNNNLSYDTGYYFKVLNDSVTQITIETQTSTKQYDLDVNFNLEKAENSNTNFTAKAYYSIIGSNAKAEVSDSLKINYGTSIEIYVEIPKENLEFFYEVSEVRINNDNSIYSGFTITELKTLTGENVICVKITRESNYVIGVNNKFAITITQNYQEYTIQTTTEENSYIENINVYKKVNNVITSGTNFNYGDTVYLTYELIANDEQYIYLFKSFKLKRLNNSQEVSQKETVSGAEYYKFVLSEEVLNKFKDNKNKLEVLAETDKKLQQYSIDINFNLIKAEDSVVDFTAKAYYKAVGSNVKTEISDDVKIDYGTSIEIYVEIPKASLEFFYEITKVLVNGNGSVYSGFTENELLGLVEEKEESILIKITKNINYLISNSNSFDVTITQKYQEYTVIVENEATTYIKEKHIYQYFNSSLFERDTFIYQDVVYLSYILVDDTDQYKHSFISFSLVKDEDKKVITETEDIQSNNYYKFVLTDELLERFKDENNNIRIITSSTRELKKYSININIIKQYEESVEENRQEFEVEAYYTLESNQDVKLDTDLEYGTQVRVFIKFPLNTLYYKYVIKTFKYNILDITPTESLIKSENKTALQKNKEEMVTSINFEVKAKNEVNFVIKQSYQTHNVCVYNDVNDIKTDNRLKTIPVKMSCEGGVNLLDNSVFKNISYSKTGYSYSDYVVLLRDNDYCPENYLNGEYDSTRYCPNITDVDWSISVYPKWVANRYKITFDTETNGGNLSDNNLKEVFVEYDSNNIFKTETGNTPVESLPVALKDNYQFIGWYFNNVEFVTNITSSSCKLKENITVDSQIIIESGKWKFTNDIVLTAQYGGVSKKFNLENGTSKTSLYIEFGTSLNDGVYLDEGRSGLYNYVAPTKINYTFLGWFIEIGGDEIQLFTTNSSQLEFVQDVENVVSGNKWICENEITAYAKFSPNKIEIILILNDGVGENLNYDNFYVDMDSSIIYINETGSSFEIAEFLKDGILSKTGYKFTGWYLDSSCSEDKKLFTIDNNELKWKEVLNYTKQDNENIVLSPTMTISTIYLYAGFSAERYKVDFITNDNNETINGITSIFFEFGSNKFYNQATGGQELTISNIPSAVKNGYRISSWKVKQVGGDDLTQTEIFASFKYSNFYTADISNRNINYGLELNSARVFNNTNWILAENIVVVPEFEARAVELILNKQSESWHTGLEESKSYYAKFNDSKIYININNQLVELGTEEIVSIKEIKDNFKGVAKFVGWGLNVNQSGIYNNLLLINVNNEAKVFEKNIFLFGVNYTDENGKFIFINRSSINLIAIAKRISKQIEFNIDDNENFIDNNGDIIENIKDITLSIYLNSKKDKLFDSNDNYATIPIVSKKGYTFIGWKLQEYDNLIIEYENDIADFVPNSYIVKDGEKVNIISSDRSWIYTEEKTVLVPVFVTNIYSISFVAKNEFTNTSVPTLKGLINGNSNGEYSGKNVKLYFEYDSGVLYDSLNLETRKVVNTPLAESIGFSFRGWEIFDDNLLFNSNGEICEYDGFIKDGCFVIDNDIQVVSKFEIIYYQVQFYASIDNMIGTYYMNYTSDKLFDKLFDGSYQEIRQIEIPEEYKIINTIASKYVFDSWVVASLDEDGNLIVKDEESGLLQHTNTHLTFKTTNNLVVVPKYNMVKNNYKLSFYVNNIETPYNISNTDVYGFTINILNVNNLESVEYGRPVEFTIDIVSSHNKSTPKVVSFADNTNVNVVNGVYTYTMGVDNKIIISDIVLLNCQTDLFISVK